MNFKKSLNIFIIACLIWNFSLTAEGISVKLRGKLALAGILSGVAYLTHTLVKRDAQNAKRLKTQLGRAEQIIHTERGFDRWEIHHYPEQTYYFLNNRFIRKKVSADSFPFNQTSTDLIRWKLLSYNTSRLTDTTFSVNPKWLLLSPLPQLLIRQSATLYPRRLEVGLWHLPDQQR